MAVNGVHGLFYSSEPEALRAVLADVFGFPHVDAGGGWLIFGLPPAEVGVHPSGEPAHKLSFMCDDLGATMVELADKGIQFTGDPVVEEFGTTVVMVLPGDVEVMLYEPSHPTAI